VEEKAGQALARGIRGWRPELVGAASGAALLVSCSRKERKGKGNAAEGIRSTARSRIRMRARGTRMADVWYEEG
jgi:hypothetical protein